MKIEANPVTARRLSFFTTLILEVKVIKGIRINTKAAGNLESPPRAKSKKTHIK